MAVTEPAIAPASLEVRPIIPGAAVTLVIAFPVGIVNQILVDRGTIDEGSPWALPFFFLIVFAAMLGGYVSGRRAPDAPLLHGAAASAAAYVVVQGIGVIRRLVVGDPLHWISYLYLVVLMATCGMVGALAANYRNRQERENPEQS